MNPHMDGHGFSLFMYIRTCGNHSSDVPDDVSSFELRETNAQTVCGLQMGWLPEVKIKNKLRSQVRYTATPCKMRSQLDEYLYVMNWTVLAKVL
jgi:hypothetical protein